MIFQGGHIKIHLNSDIPVQVDGEPWVQSPCDVVVLKSALKVSYISLLNNIATSVVKVTFYNKLLLIQTFDNTVLSIIRSMY